jgi:hypothetical protein
MYENRKQRPIARARFVRRLFMHALAAAGLLFVSLIIGMVGYEHYENLGWRSDFLNAAMLLGGMGPVDQPHSNGGKLFAGFYALYAGLVFIATATLIFTPIVHRLLHKFHWDDKL